ncbi:hypothetical protein QQF64_012866 [Cirrhinus molitorella]|uniref:Uncharacterized protein n=1 Tax=Cirrhinus molitorella TaxID=172907 RepID=A0ABR3LQS9_9TELE
MLFVVALSVHRRDEDEEETPVTESASDDNDDDDDDEREISPSNLSIVSTPEHSSKHTPDKGEEHKKATEAPPPPDSAQPSLLANLLARRKSSVSVPPSNEVSPPLRSSARLPYLPHSPFFLFSYDLEEQEEKPAQKSSRSFSAVSSPSTPAKQHNDRPALGGHPVSRICQHQKFCPRDRREAGAVDREDDCRHREKSSKRHMGTMCPTWRGRHANEGEDTTHLTSYPSSEPDTNDLEPDMEATLEPEEKDAEPEEQEEQEEEVKEINAEQEVGLAEEQVAVEEEGSEREAPDGEAEDSGILSDKERQNEEVNEKDNCSASSISSASSTLEREDRLTAGGAETGQWSQSVKDVNVNDQRNKILNSKLFMMDMLFSQSKKPSEDEDEDELVEDKERDAKEKTEDLSQDATSQDENAAKTDGDKKVENQSNVRVFAERLET